MVTYRTRQAVTVTMTVRLSEVQAGMLMFFAGLRDEPCGSEPTVRALVRRMLVGREGGSPCLELTEFGRRVVAQFDAAALRDALSR